MMCVEVRQMRIGGDQETMPREPEPTFIAARGRLWSLGGGVYTQVGYERARRPIEGPAGVMWFKETPRGRALTRRGTNGAMYLRISTRERNTYPAVLAGGRSPA